MNVNVTLLGEMITFAVLIWVTMKYIWPPITKVMQERQQKIADGLAAAKRGQENLEQTQKNIIQQLQEAKMRANLILEQANTKANNLIEESKTKAHNECAKILMQAKADVAQEINKTKLELQQQTATLVITAIEKILQQKVDDSTQQKLINQLITDIET